MELNSAIYKCEITHNRLLPKRHHFTYKIFMFWMDIDELEAAHKKLILLSVDRFNLFSFYAKDHFKFPKKDLQNSLPIRKKLANYLADNGIFIQPHQVFLLTNLRVFGYVFNPVSFYYCFNQEGVCNYVVAEIANTFGEMKLFLIDQKSETKFEQTEVKFFYVSPFTELDTSFEFKFAVPNQKLSIAINTKNKVGVFLYTKLFGVKKKLSDKQLAYYFILFPWITVQIIFAIHWQAFRLWLKGIPYHKKKLNQHLQKGIINVNKNEL